MLPAIFVGVGLIVALILPRPWLLVFLPPVVVILLGLVDSPLPPGLHWWIALVAGAATAFGIALGMLIRRLARQGAPSGAA